MLLLALNSFAYYSAGIFHCHQQIIELVSSSSVPAYNRISWIAQYWIVVVFFLFLSVLSSPTEQRERLGFERILKQSIVGLHTNIIRLITL